MNYTGFALPNRPAFLRVHAANPVVGVGIPVVLVRRLRTHVGGLLTTRTRQLQLRLLR